MRRTFLATLVAVALVGAGCSTQGFPFGVDDFTIPAGSTAGTICWVEVANTSGVEVSSATYVATATYLQGAPLVVTDDEVVVEVFGRDSAPASSCAPEAASDVRLGGPFTLVVDEPQRISVGDGEAGASLARLANGGRYWLGARLGSSFQVGGEQSISFEDGTVRVWF